MYSAHRGQAEWRLDLDKIKDKEYPIFLRKDLIDVQECESDTADYYFKIPSKQRRGGIKVPILTHKPIEGEIGETKLIKRNNNYYLHITVTKEVETKDSFDGVLGFDLGLRNPITGVALSVAEPSPKITFQGDQIKKIQTKYYYLRKNTETKKGWKKREYNRVRDKLHKIITRLVDYAEENNLIIVVGNLKGIQNQDKGKEMNRKLHRFPHYTFRQMMEYKCKERGLKYIEVSEAYTSQICYKCGEKGERHKGIFKCGGMEINSDVNGAINICRRALGKSGIRSLLDARGFVASPELHSNDPTPATQVGVAEENH